MIWESDNVAAALGTVPTSDETFSVIGTDTRAMRSGSLFVALTGENFDGHDFLDAAAGAGARGAVVRHGTPPVDGLQYFEVDDTLVALGQLANARRATMAGPVVAVTGTNGKTSTKEMLRAVLGTRFATYATRENRNNLIGVPLTILEAPADTEALVIEAGANLVGEIARIRAVVDPSAAVITNVSQGHLEGFGSLESVMNEKASLLDDVPLAVTGIVPANLPAVARTKVEQSCSAALQPPADVTPSRWSMGRDGRVTLSFRGHSATVGPRGRHQGDNAMLALALGEGLGLEATRMVEALEKVDVPAGRGSVRSFGDLTVVDDTYNSNPGSILASLELAESLRAGRPLVLGLGTMLELGDETERWHTSVAREVVERAPSLVVACGAFVEPFASSALGDRFVAVDTAEEMGDVLKERLTGNELVLLKGSRGVGLERAIPLFAPDGD